MDDITNDFEAHDRTIIHVDMDYFYAQVEEILNPSLKTQPVGIQQRNSVVTSNYVARNFGVKKMMTVAETKKICPGIILVNGEDLTKYKQISAKIFDLLLKYTPLVEKLGLDENYLDVSDLVNQKMNENVYKNNTLQIEGCIYPINESLESCDCGCAKRLLIGTYIAKEIRQELFNTLKITCCAGIAHNKFLAKLVGSMNKPNNQTVLVPIAAEMLMRELGSLKKVTGIGVKTELLLHEIGIMNINDLQNCNEDILKKKFGHELGQRLKELSFGRDSTPVRTTGKPKSIGLEDSCRPISVRKHIEEKFRLLLMRLINQVLEDGRVPVTIKIILRKYDAKKKTSHRETKQANVAASLFKYSRDQIILADGAQDRLLKIIMKLFERSVDMNKPFNITLLGLAFCKFQERNRDSTSIANFLIKKSNLEVQSITNLKSEGITTPKPESFVSQRHSTSPEPMSMDIESVSDISDLSETEVEPSSKKTRLGLLLTKRRCISHNDTNDVASPSKLRVAELRLNSRESEKDNITTTEFQISKVSYCPSDCPAENNENNIDNNSNHHVNDVETDTVDHKIASTTITGNLANIPCPSSVNPSVFEELPVDVQNELISTWRSSLTARANNTTSATSTTSNTLHRYFIKNN